MGKGKDRDGAGGGKGKGKGKDKTSYSKHNQHRNPWPQDHRRGARERGGWDSSGADWVVPEEQAVLDGRPGPAKAQEEDSSSDEGETREEFRERVKREVPKIKEDEELQEDASDSDESDNSADAELAAMFARMPARQTKPKPSKKEEDTGRTKREMKDDMKRLAEIRAKREADRQKRIDQEGWDKFAPITKTNHPPGYDLSLIK